MAEHSGPADTGRPFGLPVAGADGHRLRLRISTDQLRDVDELAAMC